MRSTLCDATLGYEAAVLAVDAAVTEDAGSELALLA
jgi:hypothetical protein